MPETDADSQAATTHATKGELFKDAVVFQFKLIVDGLRDLVLVPVSLIAAVLSLLRPGDRAGSEFYEVVRFGKQTEKMINLFGSAERLGETPPIDAPDLDVFVDRVEQFVREEASSGRYDGVRDQVDRAMRNFVKRGEAAGDSEPETASEGPDADAKTGSGKP